MRKRLKAGSWRNVVAESMVLAGETNPGEDSDVWTEIAYLDRHGEEGHLDYATYRRRGLPVGSGAIESAIQRVINLRLKGNGIFREEKNAEGMLILRGLVLSGRWDEVFAKITESLAHDRRLIWKWVSPDMPEELKSKITIAPSKPQPPTPQEGYTIAA